MIVIILGKYYSNKYSKIFSISTQSDTRKLHI